MCFEKKKNNQSTYSRWIYKETNTLFVLQRQIKNLNTYRRVQSQLLRINTFGRCLLKVFLIINIQLIKETYYHKFIHVRFIFLNNLFF